MKKIFFFSLAILAWAGAFAQIRLSGLVRDAQTKEPLTGVVIQIIETNQVTESKSDGTFQFLMDKDGAYNFKYILIGYESLTEQVILEQEKTEAKVLVNLRPKQNMLHAVEVRALRAGESTPVAYENVGKEEIKALNTGRDIPYLLEQTPSVVTTSDAGTGIGYTNMRIRGSDITRINVTVNGIPLNDAESHGVFFVNMPDFASSTNSMQVQRGVGTSTNGAAAFGGSLNMETDGPSQKPFGSVNVGLGSFNTQRYTAQFGSGLLHNNWWMSGRLSKIKSDGYVDRASSDLNSYYLSGGFMNDKTSVRLVTFSGRERTYQSWYGVDAVTMDTNRTFNWAGAQFNPTWDTITGFYKDQVDNYGQDHYQLHVNQVLNENLKINVSLNYTKGAGYYEEYIEDGSFSQYKLDPVYVGGDTINATDLVRRKWLDNDFYGGLFNIEYTGKQLTSILGGGFFQYEGDHFGKVIWARFASLSENDHEFYRSYSNKSDWNVYWKTLFDVNANVTAFLDLQVRGVNYRASGIDDGVGQFAYNQDNLFFNPKAGITYRIDDNDKVFFSYAMGNKEPNRTDLIYADPNDLPEPETLHDFEIGYEFNNMKNVVFKGNLFYMYYVNQLVLSGNIDNVGYPIRENVGQSYRIGVELTASWQPTNWLVWRPNITYMNSQNLDYFEEYEDDNGNTKTRALGNTAISFSPNIIAGSSLEFIPVKNLSVILFSKYVGQQYLSNTQNDDLKLDGYLVNDLRLSYDFNPQWIGNINVYFGVYNMFNTKYANNGYVYGEAYYFPQAGINFLGGIQVDL